ncbi:MAG: O-antigen ligase family protein [Waterburya sp.]
MKHKNLKINSFNKNFPFSLNPRPAWTAILGLFFVILVGLLVGIAPILSLVFPLGSFAVGVFLYCKYPLLYVGFTWWLWFLAPLVKRLIDYRSGYGTFGNLTLAASLVTSISLVALWKHLPKYLVSSSNRDGLPFILCAGSVFYAFIMGLIRQTTSIDLREISLSFMSWLPPISFGFYLFINWRNYPNYRQNIQRIFFWAIVVMGIYGIIQFFLVPSWDKFYIATIGKELGFNLEWFGEPAPMQLRVWSTMASPFEFSQVWVSGIILLLVQKGNFHFAITGLGYLILLLTQVRSSWYIWFLSFLFFTFFLRQEKQIRTIISLVIVVIIILSLISTTSFFNDLIIERFETFLDLENDGSFQGRFNSTADLISYGLSNFLGVGLLNTSGVSVYGTDLIFHAVDNGYITLFLSLGWFGIIPYLSGITLIFAKLFQSYAGSVDVFFIAVRAIVIGSFLGVLTTTISYGVGAMNIWGFFGIAMAAHKYNYYQHIAQKKI